jgi:hypothetical protein
VVRLRIGRPAREIARSDMALVAALAVLACLVSALAPAGLAAVRVPLGLPLALALPGYAAVSALFPPGELRPAELAILSLALSVGVVIFSGLALDVARVRLTTAPWVDLIGAVTLGAAGAAVARGHLRTLVRPRALSLRTTELLALAAALALLCGAAILGLRPLGAPGGTRTTAALGLLPAPGKAAGVCVDVTNEELARQSYELTVSAAGATRRFGPITLAPGASWTRVVPVAPTRPAVTAVLYRAAARARPYRSAAIRVWNLAAKSC